MAPPLVRMPGAGPRGGKPSPGFRLEPVRYRAFGYGEQESTNNEGLREQGTKGSGDGGTYGGSEENGPDGAFSGNVAAWTSVAHVPGEADLKSQISEGDTLVSTPSRMSGLSGCPAAQV